jgi:orotidine-5'-phosphate decarboxylase
LIYDHQKTGSVSPARAEQFASINATAGIDKVIYFPHAGLALEKEAIKAAQKEGLVPIVGGMMTHEKYSQSEGGFLPEKYIMDVYMTAGDLGVVEFVVPGTKPEKIREIRESLEKKGIESVYDVPGVEKQGGQIEDIVRAAGGNVNAISGRFIYANKEMTMTQAAENLYRRMHRTK